MPARPHRTVDRVTGILETVSLSPRGVTLAELAGALGAAKTSIQELTNGLLARGYLIEEGHRFHLGPGPFILASRANKLAALSLDHELVTELSKALGCTVLVGVRVGDAMIFTDHAGEESPSLTFAARTHARRPLYTSAAGKILLANVADDEMHRLLDLAGPEQAGHVRQFLTELPEIRSRRLAFNRGVTIADAFVVATPLLARDGRMIAAISAGIDSPRRIVSTNSARNSRRQSPPSVPNTAWRAAPKAASVDNASAATPVRSGRGMGDRSGSRTSRSTARTCPSPAASRRPSTPPRPR